MAFLAHEWHMEKSLCVHQEKETRPHRNCHRASRLTERVEKTKFSSLFWYFFKLHAVAWGREPHKDFHIQREFSANHLIRVNRGQVAFAIIYQLIRDTKRLSSECGYLRNQSCQPHQQGLDERSVLWHSVSCCRLQELDKADRCQEWKGFLCCLPPAQHPCL